MDNKDIMIARLRASYVRLLQERKDEDADDIIENHQRDQLIRLFEYLLGIADHNPLLRWYE